MRDKIPTEGIKINHCITRNRDLEVHTESTNDYKLLDEKTVRVVVQGISEISPMNEIEENLTK